LGLLEDGDDLAVGETGCLHGTSSEKGTRKFHFWRQLTCGGITQERKLYDNPRYLGALREVCEKYQWGVQFDKDGLIIPTKETAAVIMKLLLDQRLISEITAIMYDVPNGHRVDAVE
ncbi:DUF4868 domain-containing protein, partial [Xanthomonas citri pv. citri]